VGILFEFSEAIKQVVHSGMAYMNMSAAGCGAEAAIGRLTRLTSLHLSVNRRKDSPDTPLQLQLLGCGGAAGGSEGGASGSGRGSSVCGGTTARGNMGLQELSLECMEQLSDDELAAAAAALPDLRRLEVNGGYCGQNHLLLQGLVGSGLAAFGACRRLWSICLRRCEVLEGQQLVAQLPRFSNLASVLISDCPGVDSSIVGELQAAFRCQHGRKLRVVLLPVQA
jgi:hypothetical protein